MEKENPFKTDLTNIPKDKIYYTLAMFPYPSGAGLHVGHAMNFTANDIVARYKRMNGYSVINPIGWDSFGLPTEGYAMKVGKPASEVTKENVASFVAQCKQMDWSYDRDREFATSDPEYYKWTQWIFQQLYKAGLVYRKEAFVNRCPQDQTVLANDQVVDGKCERCGTEVVQKKHMQRFIKITDYAERLINDLDTVDWPEETKTQQKYWIGKSEGAEIDFAVDEATKITVFTTRPDTIYGVTALVLAPENEIIDSFLSPENKEKIKEYRKITGKKTNLERQQDAEERSGMFSGVYVTHPLTNEKVPVWFADYVLADYATGAVMFVPAHDERDDAFAYKHGLEVKIVIVPEGETTNESCYTGSGILIRSGEFDGMQNTEAKKAIIDHLEKNGLGKRKITYKLRDWSVSRQRYWGSPIPVYYDENGNPQLIPEDELPVLLPLDVKNYKPAGKSPLADHPTFPHYTAKDGKTYLRECDTLDTFMCSSFYYIRFADPKNDKQLISKDLAEKTLPVDFYIGGKEHTYGHLLYSRFIHKFLFDQGVVPSSEPFKKLLHQGFVLGPDGRKMSKRWGNVINPSEVADEFGSDTTRTYTMFMGPIEQEKVWNPSAVGGVKKFIERVERLEQFIANESPVLDSSLHKTIKGVTEDIERIKFNTAVSKLMVFVNDVYDKKAITKEQLSSFLKLLAPFATKVTETMWAKLGNEGSIHFATWPIFDASKLTEDGINLPVQINGKMRGTLEIAAGLSQNEVLEKIKVDERLNAQIEGKELAKVIYVQDKIINLIIK